MQHEIRVRVYGEGDARSLADIYYYTIHNINIRDYSKEQVQAWAPTTSLELTKWQKKWGKTPPWVAELKGQVVGFAELEPNGHIDCFYVHHEFQGVGVGSQLMDVIQTEAQTKHISRLYAEVSITAKPFFLNKGFHVVKQQTVSLRGAELTNFIMEKQFEKPSSIL